VLDRYVVPSAMAHLRRSGNIFLSILNKVANLNLTSIGIHSHDAFLSSSFWNDQFELAQNVSKVSTSYILTRNYCHEIFDYSRFVFIVYSDFLANPFSKFLRIFLLIRSFRRFSSSSPSHVRNNYVTTFFA
jgi:hypothetical protein